MNTILLRFLITGVGVFLALSIVPGIDAQTITAGIAAVLLLSFLNAIVRPLLYLFSLPLIVMTLGIFMVVINALLLQLVAYLVKGFTVQGFWPSFWGALIISVVTTILNLFISDRSQGEVTVQNNRPPKIVNPT